MLALLGGRRVHYEVTGAGDWLTLVHAAGDNTTYWIDQVAAFQRYFRVLTYDQRGLGGSSLPQVPFDPAELVTDLGELLDYLAIAQTVLVGQGLGGGVALRYALAHPKRVRALVLANNVSGVSTPEVDRRLLDLADQLEREGLEPVVRRRAPLMFSPTFAARQPERLEAFIQMRLRNTAQGYAALVRSVVGLQPPVDYRSIACPTLIIAGTDDPNLSLEAAQLLQQLIPGAELKVLETGAASAWEQPATFNEAVLEFLRRRDVLAAPAT